MLSPLYVHSNATKPDGKKAPRDLHVEAWPADGNSLPLLQGMKDGNTHDVRIPTAIPLEDFVGFWEVSQNCKCDVVQRDLAPCWSAPYTYL